MTKNAIERYIVEKQGEGWVFTHHEHLTTSQSTQMQFRREGEGLLATFRWTGPSHIAWHDCAKLARERLYPLPTNLIGGLEND